MSRSGSQYRNGFQARRAAKKDRPTRRIHGFPALPSGVVCPDCGAAWQPVCPTRGCNGSGALHDLPDSLAQAIRRERRGHPHQRADR